MAIEANLKLNIKDGHIVAEWMKMKDAVKIEWYYGLETPLVYGNIPGERPGAQVAVHLDSRCAKRLRDFSLRFNVMPQTLVRALLDAHIFTEYVKKES